MNIPGRQNSLIHLGRWLAIPHELLHVVGYHLVGKRCRYQWGNRYVTPQGAMTRYERLVGLLFPFVVFSLLAIIFGVLSTLAYGKFLQGNNLFWFILWTMLTLITGAYAGTAIGDLRQAYLLIFDKAWYSRTPFDIFFWPVVDWNEVRKNISERQEDDPQN